MKMRRALFFALSVLLLFTSPQLALAQKVYRIGGLVSADQFLSSLEGFKNRMTEMGYIEGKNVRYDLHNSKGDPESLKSLAKKLVEDKPDLIVTSSTTATLPVAKATEGTNIPVVFLSAANPLKFVKSYSSSGNNLTGVSSSSLDLTEKRLELLKQLVPNGKRVISLHNRAGVNYEDHLRLTREGAKRLALNLVEVDVTSAEGLRQKLPVLTKKVGDAIFLQPDALITAAIKDIAQHAVAERLPCIPAIVENVRHGALATYSTDYFDMGRQGAVLVDKVLRGSKPSDLPIELPSKLQLVINLKTAKAIGLKIPKEILLRTDQVIE